MNHTSANENRKTGELCFTTGCYIKPFKIIIIFSLKGVFVHKIFICFASLVAAQFLLFEIRMTQEGKLGTAKNIYIS